MKSCYYTALELARENNIKTIAFPSVSCGVYRFPIEEACKIAVDTVEEYLNNYDGLEKVIFINPSKDIVEIYEKILTSY